MPEEPEAAREVRRHLRRVPQQDPGRLAMRPCGGRHAVQRVGEPRVRRTRPGSPSRATGRRVRRTARPRRRSPPARRPRRPRPRDSTWNTPSDPVVDAPASSGVRQRRRSPAPRVPAATPRIPAGGIAHPGQRLAHRLGRGLQARDHQPVRAEVQDPADAHPLGRHDAHERRRRRGLDRHQLREEVRLGRHAVLEVHHDPVVAGPGDDLRRDDRAEVENRPMVGSPARTRRRRSERGGIGRGGGGGISSAWTHHAPAPVRLRRCDRSGSLNLASGRPVPPPCVGQLPTLSGGYRYQWVMP